MGQPWASKATDIAHNCGMAVRRIERLTTILGREIELLGATRALVLSTPEQASSARRVAGLSSWSSHHCSARPCGALRACVVAALRQA